MSGHNNSGNRRSRGNKRSGSPSRTRSRTPCYKRSKLPIKSFDHGSNLSKIRARQFGDMLVFLFCFCFTLDFNLFLFIV